MTTPFRIDTDNWKPLSTTDSFSEDLIRQFDLKRALLHSSHDQDKDNSNHVIIQQKDITMVENVNDIDDGDNNEPVTLTNRKDPLKYTFLNDLPPLSSTEEAAIVVGDRSYNNIDATTTSFRGQPSTHNNEPSNTIMKKQQQQQQQISNNNRNLLRKSSQFFRQHFMKIKTNHSHYYYRKESPVPSTITTTDGSSVEPNHHMVLQYPPRPLHYSSDIHPPADKEAKRRSLPTFGSNSNTATTTMKRKQQRPNSYQLDKRRSSFIFRNLLKQ
ncbi:hypothetical protein BDA99DRAFT_500798 [Phascolomyces articulosus]|uniref:Uncharacterized protein n=1 Tax=Phascolomyces articulosus TaxID=60185 RepID=A0AAD5KIA4_9FUNG|nr:hypothetical protein BDA99DRAFT_500798 [Phascolomyces articulosus]